MFRTRSLFAAILAISAAIAGSKRDVEWKSQFDLAADGAQNSGKPMLVEFWASWCGPCKQMDQDTWANAKVIELSKRYVCVSVDVDRAKETSDRFFVRSLPTVILATPWGEPLTRREGFVHAQDLAALMAQVPADFTGARQAHEMLAKQPKDGGALARMGQFYVKANAPFFANQYYSEALKTAECKQNPELRCELSLAIGLDYVVMGDWNQARKSLRRFQKDFPGAARMDRALAGLVITDLRQGKRGDAEKSLAELKRGFPLSEYTQQAERLVAATAAK